MRLRVKLELPQWYTAMEYSLPAPQLGQLALLSLSCGPILILLSAMILGNAVSYSSWNSIHHESLNHGVCFPICYQSTHWPTEHTPWLASQGICNSSWLNPISYSDELVNGSILDCWLHVSHYLVTCYLVNLLVTWLHAGYLDTYCWLSSYLITRYRVAET